MPDDCGCVCEGCLAGTHCGLCWASKGKHSGITLDEIRTALRAGGPEYGDGFWEAQGYAVAHDLLARLDAALQTPRREWFPVLQGREQDRAPVECPSRIPWALVEPYREAAERNHGQTLERLAERGGLSPAELWCAVHGVRYDRPIPVDPRAWLGAWVRQHDRTSLVRALVKADSYLSLLRHRCERSIPWGSPGVPDAWEVDQLIGELRALVARGVAGGGG